MKTLIIMILFLSFAASFSQARVLEKVYGVVNGEIITLTEIKDYQKKLKNGWVSKRPPFFRSC